MSAAAQTYAGDVDVRRAWELLEQEPKATLVDVRTNPECRYVGHPDLKALGKSPVFVEWQAYPDLARMSASPRRSRQRGSRRMHPFSFSAARVPARKPPPFS